ncbi:unnamed protein product [Penicillium pancosmium]
MAVDENLNLHVVQTVNLLAVVDYTAGRVSSGWLKIGLAARISQDLHLMMEPTGYLSYAEQEERRRTFWSAYLIDKLISCGQGRPIVIQDDDCYVQLPCDEITFQNGTWKQTNTLSELLNWNAEVIENPSPFALVTLMASIFGRCTRYVHRDKKSDQIPPWDTKSEFSAIKSALLLLESYSKISDRKISDILHETHPDEKGQLIFAHTLFHLCHCLLNHPFLVRLRLKPFAKAPSSFSAQALQDGADHARQLLDLLREATETGCRIESSFYAYCIAVAGSINSLASHFEHQSVARRQSDILYYFQQSLDFLNSLGKFWTHSANMAVRLSDFHSIADQFSGLLDPARLTEDLDPYHEDILWSMIDYGILGSDPYKRPLIPRPNTSNIPSPDSWALQSSFNMSAPSRSAPDNTGIFDGFSPTMRLNEVEHLLNCSPGTNGLV